MFAFIKPMFADLPNLIPGWRKGLPDSVRLAASPVVLREYLPPVLAKLEKAFPGLELLCNEGTQTQIEAWLKEKTVDLAVTTLERHLPAGYERTLLVELPLILLVPRKSKLRSASDLWSRAQIEVKLVSLPAGNSLAECFRRGLKRHGVEWRLGLFVNSIELVETYVSRGFGIGLSVLMPGHNQCLTWSP